MSYRNLLLHECRSLSRFKSLDAFNESFMYDIYPNKQKRTTTTSQKYKDFKRAANDVRQEELEFVGLGIIGIAEDVFRSVKNGKPMSLETIKKILKATGKKIPIAGTAYALFSYGSLIRTAVKYHGKI